MHIVVTGGAGFIGCNLIRSLFQDDPGLQITCIDNFDPFYPVAIKKLNIRDFTPLPGFRFIENDFSLTPANELAALVPGKVDAVIHLAAKAGVRPSIANPSAYQQVNIIGLQHLLDFARLKEVKQFVFASSSSVYGINDHFPWKEDEQLMPISPYAMTKLSGEMMGHINSRLFGLRFIALRLFTVYGPAQRPDLAIHKFTKAIFLGEPITVYGDGSTSRDYTYVDDIVKGIKAALNYNASNFEIINLGNNKVVSMNELVHSLEEVMGKKAVIQYLPQQAGDVPKTYADISKAERLLSYHPQTKLKDGLQQFCNWFNNHRELLLNL